MAPPQEADPTLASSNIASTETTQTSETPANPPGTEAGDNTSTITSTTKTTTTPRKKPGPPPKPLTERAPRIYRRDRPTVRPIKTYSRERKVRVLQFLIHHRVVHEIYDTPLPTKKRCPLRPDQPPGFGFEVIKTDDGATKILRPPTYREAGEFWKVKYQTICHWWKTRDRIMGTETVAN